MAEETNDMKPADPGKKLPSSIDRQLSTLMPEKELNIFTNQLPEEFLADASEGLNKAQDETQLDSVLKKLNHQMHQQLRSKKKRMGRKLAGDLSWIYWTVLIFLLLVVCAFIVIRMFLHH